MGQCGRLVGQDAMSRAGDKIAEALDAHMVGLTNLYFVGKALPHPYDAIGQQAISIVHDFSSLARQIMSYVDLMERGEDG